MPYKPTWAEMKVFPPRSPGNRWAYWKVEDLSALPDATKRRRNSIHFILTEEGAKKYGPLTCVHCHKTIDLPTESNIYGEYNPRKRMAKVWHYECGWGAVLSDIIIDERPNRILAPENIQL